MKKYLTVLLTFIVFLTFIGCTPSGGHDQVDPIFDQLQTMSAKGYESISLSVTVQKDGETLTSNYAFKRDEKGIRCDFTRQVLQKFEITSSGVTAPADRIKEVKGYEIIDETGKIVESSDTGFEGASNGITLASSKLSLNLSFDSSNFSGAGSTAQSFVATVNNVTAFLGNGETGAKDMTVIANFKDDAFTKIVLEYTSATNGKIKAVYTLS